MTEQQADKIIELLTEIKDKLPNKTAYDLQDIHSEIGWVKSAIEDVESAVKKISND